MNNTEKSFKLMLVTVGGTAEPIITSIKRYKPEEIFFLPSQMTISKISEILNGIDYKPIHSTHIIENENDLMECFEKYNDACTKAINKVALPSEVIIDYTGGTKNMTAALVLAANGKGFYFSYVGGQSRDKEGIGIVITGNEELYKKLDPVNYLKLEDKKKLRNYFNECRFDFALKICQELSDQYGNEKDKILFKYLGNIVDGYLLWDRFKHTEAQREIHNGVRKINDLLPYNPGLKSFINSCEEPEFLNHLIYSLKNNNAKVSDELILDLLANADRRRKEGKYDDSVARIYRTLEMIAQVAFHKKFGHTTSSMPYSNIPEDIRVNYQKYIEKDKNNQDIVKIGSQATFSLLNHVGDDTGKIFMNDKDNFENLLKKRNVSILAHGCQPIDEETNTKLFSFISDKFSLTDLPKFPVFPEL